MRNNATWIWRRLGDLSTISWLWPLGLGSLVTGFGAGLLSWFLLWSEQPFAMRLLFTLLCTVGVAAIVMLILVYYFGSQIRNIHYVKLEGNQPPATGGVGKREPLDLSVKASHMVFVGYSEPVKAGLRAGMVGHVALPDVLIVSNEHAPVTLQVSALSSGYGNRGALVEHVISNVPGEHGEPIGPLRISVDGNELKHLPTEMPLLFGEHARGCIEFPVFTPDGRVPTPADNTDFAIRLTDIRSGRTLTVPYRNGFDIDLAGRFARGNTPQSGSARTP